MESNQNPSKRRERPSSSKGELDSLEFFRTPEGSFWDPDGEYFNRYGFDVNGGFYSSSKEYVPGPAWDPNTMCYPGEEFSLEEESYEIEEEIEDY